MTEDLPTRLLAAIEAKAAKARAAGGQEWQQVDSERRPGRIEAADDAIVTYDEGSPDEDQSEHITDNDPSSVLAMCSAHREIVEDWQRTISARADFAVRKSKDPRNEYVRNKHLQARHEADALLRTMRNLARGYDLQEDA